MMDQTLYSLPAGYSLMKKCLEVQQEITGPLFPHEHHRPLRLREEVSGWFEGAIGEVEIGNLLNQLGPEWVVLHSLPIGNNGSDIDHLVFGPSGVYTINTKRHLNADVWVADRMVMVNGRSTHYLSNSIFESQRIDQLLSSRVGWSIPIRAVLAVQSRTVTYRKLPDLVDVVRGRELLQYLLSRRQEMNAEQYLQLLNIVKDPATWGISIDPVEVQMTLNSFWQLHQRVTANHRAYSPPLPPPVPPKPSFFRNHQPKQPPAPTITRKTPAKVTATRKVSRSTPAGFHAIKQCLEVQGPVSERKPLAKFFGISPLTEESTSWYKGALGEIAVAERLDTLNDNWLVMHSVPIGERGSDIDHIVVAHSGVYTINTKHHADSNVWVGGRTVMVNGHKQPYIRNSEFEADRVQKLLKDKLGWMPPVTAVLAIHAKSLNVKKAPEHVIVDETRWLVRRLKNRKRELSEEQYQQLKLLVENPDTWGIVPEDTTPAMAEFAKLQKQVKASQRTKLLWFLGFVLLGIWMAPPLINGIIGQLF